MSGHPSEDIQNISHPYRLRFHEKHSAFGGLLTAEADDSIWRSYLSEDDTNLLAIAPFDRTVKTKNIQRSLEKSVVAARARRKLADRREERAKEMIQEKGQLHMYRTENQMERIWIGEVSIRAR